MVNRSESAQAGFTLIEVMIVLLLIGLLSVTAVPFTSAWVTSAHVQQASGQVEQAVRLTKARALRNAVKALNNPANAALDKPAARLFYDQPSNQVRVCQTLSGDCTAVWWQTTLPSGVALSFPGHGSTEVEFNNRGRPIVGAVSYTLAKGDEELPGQVR